MTKEKVRKTLKRLSDILETLNSGKRVADTEIDKEALAIVEIIEELIAKEEVTWVKRWMLQLKTGKSDIAILFDMPISRAEYYLLKARLVDKIYNCCIYKGLVPYESILNERID